MGSVGAFMYLRKIVLSHFNTVESQVYRQCMHISCSSLKTGQLQTAKPQTILSYINTYFVIHN